ncbi:MAG: MSHA biogenesis protein MshD [Moraxellaceae bacterium]|nr:MAG: MSHA biogenesis protein MshD [Moraxellaceae bacterium]
MRTNPLKKSFTHFAQQGVSLIELIVFLVVISIASSALFATYNYGLMRNADPIIQVRALELAQARLDEILALKYDANTPTGGIPACGSSGVGAVACNNTTDSDMNDVDDYNGISDTPYAGYVRTVSVSTANNVKLITVTVAAPKNLSTTLAAYRANF